MGQEVAIELWICLRELLLAAQLLGVMELCGKHALLSTLHLASVTGSIIMAGVVALPAPIPGKRLAAFQKRFSPLVLRSLIFWWYTSSSSSACF
jgi:hypothetical protein